MSDRYNGAVVTFTHDIRADDARALIAAIQQLRGVANCEPHVSTAADYIAKSRARCEIRERVMRALESQ